jgi:hypothetical protein
LFFFALSAISFLIALLVVALQLFLFEGGSVGDTGPRLRGRADLHWGLLLSGAPWFVG